MPLRAWDWMGTPKTGRGVRLAIMPGRCAAPPAPAMMMRMPRSWADWAYSAIQSGVRWAETMRDSQGMASWARVSAACCMVGRSERLPMTMATMGGSCWGGLAAGSEGLWGVGGGGGGGRAMMGGMVSGGCGGGMGGGAHLGRRLGYAQRGWLWFR